MKPQKLIIFLFLVFISQVVQAQGVKTVTANPLNIAVQLALVQDSTKISQTLAYYGYAAQLSDDEYRVFKHPDGTIIRYSYPDTDDSKQRFPIVKVTSRKSPKEIEKTLKDLDFKKNGNTYENTSSRFSNYITKCSLDHENTLTIQRLKK